MEKRAGRWPREKGERSKERASGGDSTEVLSRRPAETIVNLDYRGQFPVGVAQAARVARTLGVREQASVGRHPGPGPRPSRSISPPQLYTHRLPLSPAPASPLCIRPSFGYVLICPACTSCSVSATERIETLGLAVVRT